MVRGRFHGVAYPAPVAVQPVLSDDPVGYARADLQERFGLFEGAAPSQRYPAGTDRETLQKGD